MFTKITTISLLTLLLAACQTTQESMADAHQVCSQAGFKRNTDNHAICVSNAYRDNRLLAEKRRDDFFDGLQQSGFIMSISGRY